MSAFYVNMANLKKQITIVLLGVFILVKISPAYYLDQYLPLLSTENTKSAAISFRAPLPEKFLIRIDKGVIESDTFKAISKVQSSPFPLTLAFLAAFFLFSGITSKINLLNGSFFQTKRYLSHGVLRL